VKLLISHALAAPVPNHAVMTSAIIAYRSPRHALFIVIIQPSNCAVFILIIRMAHSITIRLSTTHAFQRQLLALAVPMQSRALKLWMTAQNTNGASRNIMRV
jgi:hypothetical protein